jgi:hypothetical protein
LEDLAFEVLASRSPSHHLVQYPHLFLLEVVEVAGCEARGARGSKKGSFERYGIAEIER